MASDLNNNIDREAPRREREEREGGGRRDRMDEEEIGMPISVGYGSSSSKAKILTGGDGIITNPHSPVDEMGLLVAVSASGLSTKMESIKYQECLKNHAASIGGHAVDGCCEFMPSGEEGTLDALKCAACNCHRNFHRREAQDEKGIATPDGYYCYNFHNNDRKMKSPFSPNHLVPPQQKFHLGLPSSSPVPQMIMGFGGGATESSSEDLNTITTTTTNNNNNGNARPPMIISKKRFRTKFTQDQKEKMLSLAEKLGWRIQKQDEVAVQQFCSDMGVKRRVLKVWMHNNKHTMKKPQ